MFDIQTSEIVGGFVNLAQLADTRFSDVDQDRVNTLPFFP